MRAERFRGTFHHFVGRCGRVARSSATMIHVLAILGVVELFVRSTPLPRLSRMLGCELTLAPLSIDAEPISLAELPPTARRKVECARRAADAWPFSQGPCLRSALASGHMLRRLHPRIRLGLIGSGDLLSAHAWLEIGGRPLEDISGVAPFSNRREDD